MIGLPVMLAVAIMLVFSYDTFAAYYKDVTNTANSMTSKSIVFRVNSSTASTVTLPAITVAPAGSNSWTVTLDAQGSEAALDAAFTLNLAYSGTWAPGLSVTVNGSKITPGSPYTLNFTNIYNGGGSNTVTIVFAWDTSPSAGYCRPSGFEYFWDRYILGKPIPGDYNNFAVTASATVKAVQRRA